MKTWQGSLAVSDHHGIVSPAYFVCHLDGDVHPRYVHHLLRSAPYVELYASMSKGIRPNQWDLPFDQLRTVPVILPPREDQQRIADFLDDQVARIDEVIRLREQQVSTLTARERAVIDASFAPSHRTEVKRIKHLLAARPRYGVLVPRYVDESDGVPFVRVGDLPRLNSGELDLPKIPSAQSREFARTQLGGGEVLLGVVGKMGTATVAPAWIRGANVARAVAVLSCIERDAAPMLSAWFRSSHFQDQAALATSGDSVQPTLGMGDLAGFNIYWPTDRVSAGRELAADLESVAAARAEMSAQIDLLQERKRALITAAVSGEFDVSTASGRGVA